MSVLQLLIFHETEIFGSFQAGNDCKIEHFRLLTEIFGSFQLILAFFAKGKTDYDFTIFTPGGNGL